MLRTHMATDQSAPPMDDFDVGQDDDPPQTPGIAHLTVVPENADRS